MVSLKFGEDRTKLQAPETKDPRKKYLDISFFLLVNGLIGAWHEGTAANCSPSLALAKRSTTLHTRTVVLGEITYYIHMFLLWLQRRVPLVLYTN